MKKPRKTNPFRIATFDLETTGGFNGSYAGVLCACFKFNDEDRIRVVNAQKFSQEEKAIKRIRDLWCKADMIVGWNSLNFDRKFMNARLLHYALPILPQKFHIDLMWNWRKHTRVSSTRLGSVLQENEAEFQKTHPTPDDWAQAARAGNREAYAKIVERCQSDVLGTEEMLCKAVSSGMILTLQRR